MSFQGFHHCSGVPLVCFRTLFIGLLKVMPLTEPTGPTTSRVLNLDVEESWDDLVTWESKGTDGCPVGS